MGMLTEDALDPLVAAGCPDCVASGVREQRLLFRTFVDGRWPLMAGEPVGSVVWVYDGERFVDGVYEVSCAEHKQRRLFHADQCPRCHREGGLALALSSTNRWPVPRECPRCGHEEVKYVAFVPAIVTYEGKRAHKARTTTELHEPGFHGYRVDCTDCGTVAEERARCPLCDAPGPLRARPGG